MNSLEAKVLLDKMTGPVDPARPPNLAQLTEWAEKLYTLIPAEDRYNLLFQVSVFDDDRAATGFNLSFANTLPVSEQRDGLGLILDREQVTAGDPIRRHDCSLSLRKYSSVEEFFAAVRADSSYQFACGYPWADVRLYASERADVPPK